MVTVEEASRIIFSNPVVSGTSRVSIVKSVGRVLAEAVSADRPFPPFNRVAMDGIAIDFETFGEGTRSFFIESTQAAGMPRIALKAKKNCVEVMTGALLPDGTDTVIRYEDLNIADGVAKVGSPVVRGQNVHRRGADAGKGVTLLEPGLVLSPAEVALLASVGKSEVEVLDFPRTAIVSSGDELIDVSQEPEEHQIRKSNTYALASAMHDMGWPAEMFHVADDEKGLTKSIKDLVEDYEVLILSGGVSKGKFDFIPKALEHAGVVKHFHGVSQRPGKPFWFGTSGSGKVVFALPGNPVSTFMCFYRFVRPWMVSSQIGRFEFPKAVLTSDFKFQPAITYYLQVRVLNRNGTLYAEPVTGGGSGDFANLKNVSGFLELPADQNEFKSGEVFTYIPFRP